MGQSSLQIGNWFNESISGKIGNCSHINFWNTKWIGTNTLQYSFPSLHTRETNLHVKISKMGIGREMYESRTLEFLKMTNRNFGWRTLFGIYSLLEANKVSFFSMLSN